MSASNLKKINEEFEKSIQNLIEQRLEERDGQVVVVRKFPPASKMAEPFWKRNVKASSEISKKIMEAKFKRHAEEKAAVLQKLPEE